MIRVDYKLLDGKIVTLDSGYASFIALMFTEYTLGIFDQAGSLPSDNLTTDPTWINGGASWNDVLAGPVSEVVYGENDTRLLPQQPDTQLVQNGDFTLGGVFWNDTIDVGALVTFDGGVCTLVGGNAVDRFARISQSVTTTYPGAVHVLSALVTNNPCKVRIGTTDGANDIEEDLNYTGAELSFTPPAADFFLVFESYGDGSTVVLDDVVIRQDTGGSAGISQSVDTTLPGDDHAIRVSSFGGEQFRVRVGTAEGDGTYLDEYSSASNYFGKFVPTASPFFITVEAYGDKSINVQLSAVYVFTAGEGDALAFDTPYLDEELRELYFVPTPSEATVYVLHPNHPPYKLRRDPGTGVYAWGVVSFVNPPSVWRALNWPSCGTFFQGRLWLASTLEEGQTVWASQSGIPEDFTLQKGATVVDSDGIEATLAKFGKIEWMIATKNLLVGTVNAEHILTSETGVITPNDIQVTQQSSYGSKSVQAIQIGDQVFFVSPDGLKVRAMQYEWSADNWLSRDLTFFSEHITQSGIRDLAWSQHPDQLFWCVLEDGTAACLTYERGEEIYGWHRHNTQGFIRDMAAGELYGTSYALALIQREDGNIYLEIQEPGSHFDAYAETTVAVESQTFTGFDHLAGKLVQVLLDGAVHPEVAVSEAGVITTEWPGLRCEAGLQFIPKMVTLPYDQQLQSGDAQVYMKRYNSLYVSFLDSALPFINGERPPDRTPSTPMDEREPNAVGLSRTETINLGWDKDAIVTIEQPLPLACTVLSISGEMGVKKL